jgi:carbamoyl-phosphate synthase large subunit
MGKRSDIKSILVIGSGPIVIGQACEFDYSGTQAIKALKEEGYRVILVNSNPATIMTDHELADRTYIEPITLPYVEKIIERERPCALLPTMGGQTALNIAIELAETGVLEKFSCELIGAKVDAIKTAEDRELFRRAMDEIGLESARSRLAKSLDDAEEISKELGYPLVLRPSRTLGGSGGGIVYDKSQLNQKVSIALHASPNHEVLIEESLLGWKEIELEVMRDLKDNVVIICGIENFDAMGVHTGDSITVAPLQTVTDKEYQRLRDAAIKIIRRIGVDTGGSNVQFAVNPKDGRMIVIEMNPRVSRSSALASKATGFPIAKIAAKLAVGYTLDEIPNDITKETPACFEPSIDYVVVKIPRFNFEKFPSAEKTLGTQMKSVGEVMAFGRCFNEALQKAISSMELGSYGFDRQSLISDLGKSEVLKACSVATPERLWIVGEAIRNGLSIQEIYHASAIDPWFLEEIKEVIQFEEEISGKKLSSFSRDRLLRGKKLGFSDLRLAQLFEVTEEDIRKRREVLSIKAIYKSVDTCAAEFVASTPYLYSSYDDEDEAPPIDKKKIIILGSGPNRIGQGIEFDYCCVHAVLALKEAGFDAIMVNCNPETVSTDYDVSSRLYFEPLTFESVMNIVEREKPLGVIVQFGGQTPLKLAEQLTRAGVKILGTSAESIDLAEDRKKFLELIEELNLKQPKGGAASSLAQALEVTKEISYPVMIRPSFVLGGRSMRILFNDQDLKNYLSESFDVSHKRPVLIDRYLNKAVEVDLDAIADTEGEVIIAGIMEHIERAGIHSGDSSCCIPPPTLARQVVEELKRQARIIAKRLAVCGLINIQFAITPDQEIYILEVNPRASRTVPFASKASGVAWAKIAALIMAGKTIKELGVKEVEIEGRYAVKACVFPFSKFPGVDTVLGPEMRSTGEVMGVDSDFAGAFRRSQSACSIEIPSSGEVFLSVADADKDELPELARLLRESGFSLMATEGCAALLKRCGFSVRLVKKVREGSPNVVDLIANKGVNLVVNTPEGVGPLLDSRSIRFVAREMGVPTFTTMAAAMAAAKAIKLGEGVKGVKSIQEWLESRH